MARSMRWRILEKKKLILEGKKMTVSLKLDIKLLHSLDFNCSMLCSITEEILQPRRHMIK